MLNNKTLWIPVFFLFFLFNFYTCRQPSTSITQNISQYLPASGEVDDWHRERALLYYSGEELFDYINGGAEIYYEYGFKNVAIQDYKNSNERSLSVEIYEMKNPAAAYGIYSFKKSPDGAPWESEYEGRLEGYYLNFWKGCYLVTITGFDEEAETIKGIKSIALSMAEVLPDKGDAQKPPLAAFLPKDNLIPGTEKYFMGNLGLFNSYAFSQRDIFNISEGVGGVYKQGYRIFILQYGDPFLSFDQFKEVKTSLQEDPKYSSLHSTEKSFSIQDDKNTLLHFLSADQYIVIVVDADSPDEAEAIAAGIKFKGKG